MEGHAIFAAQIINQELIVNQAGDVRLVIADAQGRKIFETKDEGHGSAVTNAVTGTRPGTTRTHTLKLKNGNRIYLASDGLWANVTSEAAIQDIAGERSDVALQKLEARAKAQMKEYEGSPDNITIFIYDVLLKR